MTRIGPRSGMIRIGCYDLLNLKKVFPTNAIKSTVKLNAWCWCCCVIPSFHDCLSDFVFLSCETEYSTHESYQES